MGRSTVHYADNKTNTILKKLHNKLRPAGTPVQRVEYIIELLLLRIFEVKLKRDDAYSQLRKLFSADYTEETEINGKKEKKKGPHQTKLFYHLQTVDSKAITEELNKNFFPFYGDIVNHARKVLKGNMNTKVQDQMVLIQEVFKNSNFTNNVQSGNLEEVIEAVADLDEDRLLNTDLLGDAIESALSETGGTKDIGLFRTPDHIRQFMVGLLEPSIKDSIYDPACGTGGFLFDAFEFVMESITNENTWPGPKSHPELSEWFRSYFKKHKKGMPSIDESNQFYRNGVFGVEYLGMIRKMAAVNFYIRGLNPHNIQQGDSLALFDYTIAGSKSVVLANPPFGAERDQEAYPNVWDEFSKESETTILFVKMMLDSLKPGGRCAVVVSEGFLTWEQTSAKSLRKMLLEEVNLQAVIGLPQGVFISKTGQGPKTSVLVFEKGNPTKNIWFYQVTNDGFTKGANRTHQKGCQLVEVLDLYHKYVKKGKSPHETNNSFTLSVDWLKLVDPRVKEKIREDTRQTMEVKKEDDKELFLTNLKKKLNAKKIDKGTYKEEIWKFETTWENRIANEIAKRIDRAHVYSLNATNYRSNLNAVQVAEWNQIIKPYLNGTHKEIVTVKSLDNKYELLKKINTKNAIKLIAEFHPENAIEADIVREYLNSALKSEAVEDETLKQIRAIFKNGAKFPMVMLKDVCNYEKGKSPTQATSEGQYPFVVTAEERKTASNFQFDGKAVCIPLISSTGHGHASMKRIHYQEGKFALANLLFALFPKDEEQLNMKYLYYILTHKLTDLFVPLMKGTANVSMKMEDAVNVSFPLPPIDKQFEIVAQLEKLQEIIEGTNKIINNYEIDFSEIETKYPKKLVSELITNSLYGSSDKAFYGESGYKILRIGNISFCNFLLSDIKRINLSKKEFEKYKLQKNDFLIVRSNGNPKLVGKCAVWEKEEDYVYASYLIRFRFDETKVSPKFIMYFLSSKQGRKLIRPTAGGGTYNLSATEFEKLSVPVPHPEIQEKIIGSFENDFSFLKSAQDLSIKTEQKIRAELEKFWNN